MDIALETKIKDIFESLKTRSKYDIDFQNMDPVVKLLFVALADEMRKIEDNFCGLEERMIERYCTYFIPRENIEATPAITFIQPQFNPDKDSEAVTIESGLSFTFNTEAKQVLNFIPLFQTEVFPIGPCKKNRQDGLDYVKVITAHSNKLWVGITTDAEIESLNGLTMLIKGTSGVNPERIYVGSNHVELDFATVSEMDRIKMLSPFDSQQAFGSFFSIVEHWRECLHKLDNAIWLCVTDKAEGRDRFKKNDIPLSLRVWMDSDTLKQFPRNTLWLQIDFPEGYIVPEDCKIQINVIPVVNVEERSVALRQFSPIAKIGGDKGPFLVSVLNQPNNIIIRDFDANCYNNGDLYREVRNLYHHFIDDYYAFVELNEIRDGETLKKLVDAINKIGNTTAKKPNKKYKFDPGTYVMKKLEGDASRTSTVIVNYLVTQGTQGNEPQIGKTMVNNKHPLIKDARVMAPATGGRDKASVDERYALLRYYALTNDRLYTMKDIEAFLRKEMSAFGEEEWKRITPKMSIKGAGGTVALQRGLYIDIEFKDKKNYDKAMSMHYDTLIPQRIRYKSCIPMPIIVKLKNLEE